MMKDNATPENGLGLFGTEPEGPPQLPDFQPTGIIDFEAIPATEFIYKDFYARGYTSLTIAAPKVGKSQLALSEAMDLASGGKVLGTTTERLKVLYFNAEDDQNVLHARYAATCITNGIDQEEFGNRLFLESGIQWPDFFLIDQMERQIIINERVFAHLARQVEDKGFDVVVFDPLQDLSHSDESNEAFRMLGRRIRDFANDSGVSVHLIHHTRKVTAGISPTIDDARGGSALRGTCRFNRILVAMSEAEAIDAGESDPRFFFRIGDMESNLAPPSSARNQWFQKTGANLPNGQNVGALVKWNWPDAFDGVTLQMAVDAVRELEMMPEGMARQSPQADNWFGYVVARVCNITMPPKTDKKPRRAAKAKVQSILSKWVDNNWLVVAQKRCEIDRKKRPCYAVGDTHPNET